MDPVTDQEDQALAMEIVGKALEDCTVEDFRRIAAVLDARAATDLATADRMKAALDEAARCGCRIAIPVLPGGSPNHGAAFVHHTCGKGDANV